MALNLLFMTVKDNPDSEQIEKLAAEFPLSRTIEFYSMDMESLTTIAKHRLLPVPTVLVFNNTKVIARFANDIPSLKSLRSAIALLE